LKNNFTQKKFPQEQSTEKFQLKKREIKKRSILHVQIAHFISNAKKGKSLSGTSPKTTDNLTLKPFTKPSTNYYPYQNNSLYKPMSYQPPPQRIQTFQNQMYSNPNLSRQVYSTVSPLPPAPIQTRSYPIHNPYAPPLYSSYSRGGYDLMQNPSNTPQAPNHYRHQGGYYDNPNSFNQRRSYPPAPPLNQSIPPRSMSMNQLKYPFKHQK
jgi:hypothetical protein